MGLYVSFGPEDAGFPIRNTFQIRANTGWSTQKSGNHDYSLAGEAFVATFMSIALELCPVRTGYLRSTIHASHNGGYCYAYADAEYAQYVEYGTWKMEAQPFFRIALAEAFNAYIETAYASYSELYFILCEDPVDKYLDKRTEHYDELAERAMDRAEQEEDPEVRSEVFRETFDALCRANPFFMVFMGLLLFPVLVFIYALYRTISDALLGEGTNYPQIEIT